MINTALGEKKISKFLNRSNFSVTCNHLLLEQTGRLWVLPVKTKWLSSPEDTLLQKLTELYSFQWLKAEETQTAFGKGLCALG